MSATCKDKLQRLPAAIGMNDNVTVNGEVFHVQTEDLGKQLGQVVTHVFAEGVHVVKVARLDYSQHLNSPNLNSALPKVVRAHHQAVTRKLLAGTLVSLPELLALPSSTEAETALMNVDKGVGCAPSRTSTHPQSDLESTVSHASFRGGSEHPQRVRNLSTQPPRSRASIWNELVQEAHLGRRLNPALEERHDYAMEVPEATSTIRRSPLVGKEITGAPPSSNHSWEKAVEKVQGGAHRKAFYQTVTSRSEPCLGLTESDFEDGQRKLASNDISGALVCFARCVALTPDSKRFRSALRQVLDLVDE